MFSIRAVLAAGCVAALCALPQAGAAAGEHHQHAAVELS